MTATLSSVHCCLTMMNGTTSGSVQSEPRADAKELTSRGQSLIVLLAAAREGECAAPSAGTGQVGGGLAITQRGPLPRRFVWQLKEMSKTTHRHLVIRLRGRIKKALFHFCSLRSASIIVWHVSAADSKRKSQDKWEGKKTVASITTGNVSGRIMLTLCSIMFPKTETLGTQNKRQRRRTKLHENKTSGPASHSRLSYFLTQEIVKRWATDTFLFSQQLACGAMLNFVSSGTVLTRNLALCFSEQEKKSKGWREGGSRVKNEQQPIAP